MDHVYKTVVRGADVKVYIDDILHLFFNFENLLGVYSFRDGPSLYGIALYLKGATVHLEYETRDTWEAILKELNTNIR